jgi:hypothetical protein
MLLRAAPLPAGGGSGSTSAHSSSVRSEG